MIKVFKNEDTQYICTQPKEYRVNFRSQSYQWVVDFTIFDKIDSEKLDELLDATSLTFVYYDDTSGEVITSINLEDYTIINTMSITYGADLSCSAYIQLGKEITNYGVKV